MIGTMSDAMLTAVEVEQRNQVMKLNAVADGKCLHELEADAASGKVGVWVCVVQAFGIQDGDGRGQDVVRYMMVADDEVDSLLFGIRYFFYGFDAAVEYDDQALRRSLRRSQLLFWKCRTLRCSGQGM